MRVLVFGTGGVGGIYAYILQKGGAKVTVVCRSNYDAVVEHGIEIDSAIFGLVHFVPDGVVRSVVDACIPPHDQPNQQIGRAETNGAAVERGGDGAFDYVLVTAKALPGTAALIAAAVSSSPRTAIVLAQNGIDVEEEYRRLYPRNIIISGVVYLPTTQISPGKIRMGNLQRLHIGSYPATTSSSSQQEAEAASKAVRQFADTFTAGGGVIFTHDDVQQQRWIKLSVNVAWNPVCALSRCDDANFLRSSTKAEDTVRGLMAEVASVAAAHGYGISQDVIDEQLQRPRKRLETGGKEPSMLTDVREGRAMEVDAIVGNAIEAARRVGVETPRLDLLYGVIKGLDYSIRPDERWKPIA